ncbi:MAG: hypothetical protein ABI379_11835 [Rhodanobacter sp.]
MHRPTLLASALAVLLAGSAAFAFAQNMPAAPATRPANSMTMRTTMPMGKGGGAPHSSDVWGHGANRQASGVIGDLHSLERLYMEAGRSKDLAAVYKDVLSQSQDPRVRTYVYHRLARLQSRPANVDQAIATLRKSLDENLANAARMRTEREQMRLKWQEHQKGGSSNAAATSPD